ncbi:MAG: hypothetical protein ACKOC5_05105 [Chloroflexota bacterium]
MAKLIPAAKRIELARGLIQKARDYPVPAEFGRNNLSYLAEVKDLLRQAADMVKFITYTPTATPEMKKEVEAIFAEIEQAKRDLLRG